jgi:hypothetical protein
MDLNSDRAKVDKLQLDLRLPLDLNWAHDSHSTLWVTPKEARKGP